MNETKQKVLIVILAVVALGAGVFWFTGSNKTTTENQNSAPLVRKVRDTSSQSPTRKTTKRTSPDRRSPTLERKERADAKRPDVRRKNRRTAGKKLEKKKKVVPAS